MGKASFLAFIGLLVFTGMTLVDITRTEERGTGLAD